jgi:hypothetical protein
MVKHWSMVTGECMKYGWEQITPWYRVIIEELLAKKFHFFIQHERCAIGPYLEPGESTPCLYILFF